MKRHKFFCIMVFVVIVIIGFVNTLAQSSQSIVQNLFQKGNAGSNEIHIIDAPFIGQMELYPTGCESTSAVMALQFLGIDISVDDFIDNYLDLGTPPFEYDGILYGDSPWDCFLGSPYDESGWGCYSPVVKKRLTKSIE